MEDQRQRGLGRLFQTLASTILCPGDSSSSWQLMTPGDGSLWRDWIVCIRSLLPSLQDEQMCSSYNELMYLTLAVRCYAMVDTALMSPNRSEHVTVAHSNLDNNVFILHCRWISVTMVPSSSIFRQTAAWMGTTIGANMWAVTQHHRLYVLSSVSYFYHQTIWLEFRSSVVLDASPPTCSLHTNGTFLLPDPTNSNIMNLFV